MGLQVRHRRAAECRQVDALQRVDQTASAQAANYPFCTIEPNVGEVAMPEPRLDKLAAIAKSKEIIPTRMNFVDIAGLVRGASKGEGLGNQFLANIRECDAIAYVVRCFENDDITHVEGRIDPIADLETVETELMLADLDSLEKRVSNLEKKAKTGDKDAKLTLDLVLRAKALLEDGEPARHTTRSRRAKSFRVCCSSLDGPARSLRVQRQRSGCRRRQRAHQTRRRTGQARATPRASSSARRSKRRSPRSRKKSKPNSSPRRPRRARPHQAHPRRLRSARLKTYFTVGPKEARAWTIHKGWTAPQAAGVIHTDFEKGFIRAETIAYADFIACNGENGAKEAGKMRLEGKDYVVAKAT